MVVDKLIEQTGSSEFAPFGLCITCPVCGGDYVCPMGPGVAGLWAGRGSATFIRMDCEAGHNFEIGIGFHKGQSWIFTRHLPVPESTEQAHPMANGSGGWHAR